MRKLIINEQLSLDGVMQGPGGPDEDTSGGFPHGGWAMPYFDEAMGKAAGEGMGSAGGLVLGRRTYEIFAGYWPHEGDDAPFAGFLNKVPKYVASRTLKEPLEWNNSHLLRGDVVEAVRRLKEEDGEDLVILGSGDLAQTLIEDGLIDEYSIWIDPIVLGTGKRLFREGVPKTLLELVDSTTSSTGVTMQTYRPVQGSQRSRGPGVALRGTRQREPGSTR
jgi:dihydrofolate reductase